MFGVSRWGHFNSIQSAKHNLKHKFEHHYLMGRPPPPLVDPIRHVITDSIYPYPYRVVITTSVAEQLDTYPDL